MFVGSGKRSQALAFYSYDRVSSALQATQGKGLERQSSAAQQWCEGHGVKLDDSLRLSDPGLSAFHGDNVSEGQLGVLLRMAQAGEIERGSTLLIEDLDRITRTGWFREGGGSASDLISGLLQSGIKLITLQDGQEYTANSDLGQRILLMAKADSAAEYSKRLSSRITASWDQTIAALEAGRLPRGNVFVPSWCERRGDEVTLIPAKVEIVQAIFEMALTDGDLALSTRLNADGVPTLVGKPKWTRAQIKNLLEDPKVWGAVRLNRQDNMSAKRRQRRGARAAEERIFPGLLPAALPKETVDRTLAARAGRTDPKSGHRVKTTTCWNIASGLTRCSCGASCTSSATNSGSRKDKDGKPLVLRYLRCADRCGAKSYRLEDVNGHLLTRLSRGALQKLLASDSDRDQQVKREQQAVAALQAQLVQAEQAEANASRLFKDALKAGTVDPLFQSAVEEARAEVKDAKTALAGAQQRLAGLRHDIDTVEFDAALQALFGAFAKGQDTPQQRQAINRFLRSAGFRVILDAAERRVGMAIGDGEMDWQPLAPGGRRAALVMGEANPLAATDDAVVLAGGRETGDPDRVTVVIPADVSDDEAKKIAAKAVRQMKSPEE